MSELRDSILHELLAEPSEVAEEAKILMARIEEIQRRLGTPGELPNDTTRVSDLVHRLNNLCTRFRLLKAVRGEE
ncbi:hypothetical protein DB347_16530 [Opitutaceae bacterium EW11]|nr:hypothetical protein DB347_16530 [Opitutaceae bacterium EW11]